MRIALTSEQEDLRQTVCTLADRFGAVSLSGSRMEIEAGQAGRALDQFGIDTVVQEQADAPWKGCIEAAVITTELARRLVPGTGLGRTLLAAPILRLLGCPTQRSTLVLAMSLSEGVIGHDAASGVAWDCDGSDSCVAIRLGSAKLDILREALPGDNGYAFDLTRSTGTIEFNDTPEVSLDVREVPTDLLNRWRAWCFTAVAADTLGVMEGAQEITTAYAKERHQFGRSIASFQAVQHLLADQYVALRGARVAVYHAAWALEELSADEALNAAHVAKAQTAAAVVLAAETMVQVHGGIGFTWEHGAHLY
ncbi:MAG TPA: acyl-CoA dehydrogenase family protein, partial [Acidimicrobiales bacterium]